MTGTSRRRSRSPISQGPRAAMKSGDAAWMKMTLAAVVILLAWTKRMTVVA